MRLKPQDLLMQLQRGLAPLYFIVGEEPQQQLEVLNQIRAAAHQFGYGQRERYDITPQFDWEKFQTQLGERSLFAEKRFIEGRFTSNIGKLGARILVEILNDPPADTLLLFSSDKLENSVAKSAWFTAVERLAVTVWTRPLTRSELSPWIRKRSQERGIHLSEAAVELLAERTEGNLLATEQAIEKLGLYVYSSHNTSTQGKQLIQKSSAGESSEIIQAEAIAAITGVDTQFSLFDLVDTALLGDSVRTKQILTRLKGEGVESILILWAITREVRTIIPLAEAVHKGMTLAQGMREHNLWKHKLPFYTSLLKRHSLTSLHQWMIQAKEIDHLIKGRGLGDVWSALLVLCLSLAGAAHG